MAQDVDALAQHIDVVALYRDAEDEYGECGALECGCDGSDMWMWCLRT